ncbi:uncharacterized protein LOC135145657 isoform X2 [Zophobas morio]|uniref:uncharacterized protein LOC135145657 isoform X2 n=1 Tax=Zophobas morio TaxID=2755281 RepID=UPI003083C787
MRILLLLDLLTQLARQKYFILKFQLKKKESIRKEKNVWLSLDIFKEEDSNFFEDNKKSGEAIFEIGQLYMQSLYNHLSQALRTLNYLRNRELHHRDIAESTANRVVLWSLVECLVLLSVAGVQVYLVRRMFSKSASYTSFK